ncbi:MAG: hypothetical protein JXA69_03710 [Phycisphaerae bacterium]|nr:hypothetical protein [Phycisphaerae bacterium]
MRCSKAGNLDEWARVLERLDEWSREGTLEQHQEELVQLLGHPDNWRLREAALEAIREIREPTDALVRATCHILMDDGLYLEVRVLAAEALAALFERLRTRSDSPVADIRHEVRETIHALLSSPQPPVMHQAARRILPTIE